MITASILLFACYGWLAYSLRSMNFERPVIPYTPHSIQWADKKQVTVSLCLWAGFFGLCLLFANDPAAGTAATALMLLEAVALVGILATDLSRSVSSVSSGSNNNSSSDPTGPSAEQKIDGLVPLFGKPAGKSPENAPVAENVPAGHCDPDPRLQALQDENNALCGRNIELTEQNSQLEARIAALTTANTQLSESNTMLESSVSKLRSRGTQSFIEDHLEDLDTPALEDYRTRLVREVQRVDAARQKRSIGSH